MLVSCQRIKRHWASACLLQDTTTAFHAHACIRRAERGDLRLLSGIRPDWLGDRFMTGHGDIAQYRCCPDLASCPPLPVRWAFILGPACGLISTLWSCTVALCTTVEKCDLHLDCIRDAQSLREGQSLAWTLNTSKPSCRDR